MAIWQAPTPMGSARATMTTVRRPVVGETPETQPLPLVRFLLTLFPMFFSRTARVRPLHALCLVAALLSLPGVAEAQITADIAQLTGGRGNRTTASEIIRGFGIADCTSSDAAVQIQVNNVPAAAANRLDIWHSNGASVDCIADANARSSDPAVRTCVHLRVDPVVDGDSRITIPLADIVAGDTGSTTGADICGRERRTYRFYLIGTGSDEEVGTVAATQFGFFDLTIDAVAPAAPVPSPLTLEGNNVTVDWPNVSDADPPADLSYRVYIESDGCGTTITQDGGGVRTDGGTEDAGMSVDAGTDAGTDAGAAEDAGLEDAGLEDAGLEDGGMTMMSIVTTRTTGPGESSTTLDLNALGVAEGGQAGLRIASIDQAGNEGALSAEVCITRRTGVGFCDAVEGGCGEGGCAVSLPGGSEPPSPLLLLSLSMFGLVYVRRRTVRAKNRARATR